MLKYIKNILFQAGHPELISFMDILINHIDSKNVDMDAIQDLSDTFLIHRDYDTPSEDEEVFPTDTEDEDEAFTFQNGGS